MKRIKGASFNILRIDASDFHGYGISVLTIEWLTKGNICMLSYSWVLFSIYISKPTDESLRIGGSILGIKWYKYLKPKLVRVCKECRNNADSDYISERSEYWCDECGLHIPEENTELIEVYNE